MKRPPEILNKIVDKVLSYLPSVTQVLSNVFEHWVNFSQVPPEVLEAACERGTDVHALVAAYAQKLWIPEVPPEYAGYFKSARRWFDKHVVAVHLVETRIVDPNIGYHGQPDYVLTIRGDHDPSLWDLKTGITPNLCWPLQVAAYDHLVKLEGFEVRRRGTIIPARDGGPVRLIPYTEPLAHYFNVFLSALNVWRYANARR